MNVLIINGRFSFREKKIVEHAYREIKKNKRYYNKSQHCSVLTTDRGFIICSGINKEISELHSEESCLKKFNRMATVSSLKECVLWNVRISRHNEVRNSKPCRKCAAYLDRFSPRKVFFTNDNGEFETW